MINEYLQQHRDPQTLLAPAIVCADGFTLNVQAMYDCHCTPTSGDGREAKNVGPWSHVEIIGRPSQAAPQLEQYEVIGEVFAFVPVETVESLIAEHGGLRA